MRQLLVMAGMAAMVSALAPVVAAEEGEAKADWRVLAERGQHEAALKALNRLIEGLGSELAALKKQEPAPRDRIAQVEGRIAELRQARERLQGALKRGEGDRPREGQVTPQQRERAQQAEKMEAQIRELNQALERREVQFKDMVASYGEDDQRVQAGRKELQHIRARRDALLTELKAFLAQGREGDRREGDRREGERREGADRDRREGERREGDRREGERHEGERREGDRREGERREGDRPRDAEGAALQERAARMEQESQRLAEACRRAEGREREELRGQLRNHLNGLFDLRLQIRAREVERLERELGGLRERLEARRRAKERIVEQRLRQLLGEHDEWEW